MRILRVRLQAAEAKRAALRRFYGERLGLPTTTDRRGTCVEVGSTVLELAPAAGDPFYHFALRVPRNRFEAARAWIAERAELLPERETGETTFRFASWDADACYVHDPCGNVVELIAHHGLEEEGDPARPFSGAELLGVCEIGLVGPDLRGTAGALEPLGIRHWDGSLEDGLAFLGDRDGVAILSPPGRGWLPTRRPAEPHPVDLTVAGRAEREAALPGSPHRVRTALTAP